MSRRGPLRALTALGVAAAATRLSRAALARAFGDDDPRFTRTNHRGEPISLLEGPAVAVGLVSGALASGGRLGAASAFAAAGGAVFGLVDDLSEDTSRTRKGLRGHLGALRHGELTTGGLKVLGIGTTSLVAAAIAHAGSGRRAAAGRVVDVAVSGALVAATANLVNLLDLRPGRALKAVGIVAAPAALVTGAPAAAACVGAGAAAIGPDLAERDMLGDGGANALGALLGASALGAPRVVRGALLTIAVGLTLASERVSFTEVIARTPALREIDAWGRR